MKGQSQCDTERENGLRGQGSIIVNIRIDWDRSRSFGLSSRLGLLGLLFHCHIVVKRLLLSEQYTEEDDDISGDNIPNALLYRLGRLELHRRRPIYLSNERFNLSDRLSRRAF